MLRQQTKGAKGEIEFGGGLSIFVRGIALLALILAFLDFELGGGPTGGLIDGKKGKIAGAVLPEWIGLGCFFVIFHDWGDKSF